MFILWCSNRNDRLNWNLVNRSPCWRVHWSPSVPSSLFGRTLVRSRTLVDYFHGEISFIAVRETKQVRAEIVSTLAVANRMYSEVEENVPDPSPLSANRKEIETILEQVGASERVVVQVLERADFRCLISKHLRWNSWVIYNRANMLSKVTIQSSSSFDSIMAHVLGSIFQSEYDPL